jgi:NAD(P)-dependent dehydrogenase (short-subunit alcohol dehydrogenase family)
VLADVGLAADVDRIVEHAMRTFGRVDTLVNNAYDAGLEDEATVLDVPDVTWDRVFQTNLFAPLRLTRALAKQTLAAEGTGSVINVISGSGLLANSAPGHLPAPTMAPYGVSKAALWMLTRYLAAELGPQIRVNALCPGLTSEGGAMRKRRTVRAPAGVRRGAAGGGLLVRKRSPALPCTWPLQPRVTRPGKC